MKSDYRIVLFCLVFSFCIVGIFFWVDSSVPASSETPADSTFVSVAQAYDEGEKSIEKNELFRFDPNTADSTALLRLGLKPWIVRSIIKYRSRGGVYSSPEDFARVPGLIQKQYKELLPYITIGDDYKEARTLVGERKHFAETTYQQEQRDTTVRPKKMLPAERLAINAADTTALKKVPGLGSYFAKRIVDYREKLGGFVSLDQLLEIRNFPESALQYLTIPDGGIKKININKADFKQLSAHPYIGYSRTKVIMEYRRLKGKISSLNQLALMNGFSKEETKKMEPYIEY